jgi:HSP20 family protein
MYGYGEDQGDLHTRIKQMFEEARAISNRQALAGPFVYGFSMKFTDTGKPVVAEFGNVSPYGINGYMEPTTDVIERINSVSVLVELPGVAKEDIDLRASVESLFIKVDTPFRKFVKDIRFSCRVRPDSTQARFNNGVLEITILRVDDNPAGKKVQIK